MLISDITRAIEDQAPLRWQESYDNAGMQVGNPGAECTGVLLCVDVTPAVVDEAVAKGCNLIVSHHPLIFKGLKNLTGATLQQRAVMDAIVKGVAVYAGHTNLDNAPAGVSMTLASMLGIESPRPLEPVAGEECVGLGAVGTLASPLTPTALAERVKSVCGSPVTRCTSPAEVDGLISRVAVCGGSGGSLIEEAIGAGAQAYVTSDVRYHDFVDYGPRLFIIDIGHYESEMCTKHIFYRILSQKFPNFAVHYSETERNPINYL